MINSMGYMLTQYIVCHDKQYGLHAYTIYSFCHGINTQYIVVIKHGLHNI